MREGYVFSGALHALVLAFVLLGLPEFLRHKPAEIQPIAVQLVNLADVTRALHRNPKPVEKAKIDNVPKPDPTIEPVKEDALQPPEIPPAAPEPAPAPKPEPPKPEPPKPEPPKPEPKPAPPPEPPKPQPPKPQPPKPQAPKPKPEPPKPDKRKAQDQAFDAILKNLSKQARKIEKSEPPKKPAKPVQEAQSEASAQPDAPLGERLSTSQIDTIRQQFERCWSVPAGARDAKNLRVEIRVEVNPDGTVRSAEIVDSEGRYNGDTFWRAAAESALRAVNNPQCSKLDVPLDKYDQWKDLDLFFDPKDML